MKYALLFFVLSAQTICAGLEEYSKLVVADGRASAAPRHGVRVTYLGTNGFEFRSGRHALIVDPYFSRINFSRVAFGSPIQPDLARINDGMKRLSTKVDGVVVTHGHEDHLLDVPVVMRTTGARLIASRTSVQLAQRAGAPASRCDVVTAGSVRRIGPWKIRALPATHDRLFSSVSYPGEAHGTGPPQRASDWVCGEPLAYLIEINGMRIYVDSGGSPAVLPPASIGPVDLAILGVALPDSRDRFSAAVQRLRPRYLFPSHQDNFFRPLNAGFEFGLLTDFPRVLHDYKEKALPGRLVLLDYFRPWTLQKK